MSFQYTGNKCHPNQKPVEALRKLIWAFSKPGNVVLDPFAGSASTAVAAQWEQRRFIAIEMMPQYFEAAKQRLEQTQT